MEKLLNCQHVKYFRPEGKIGDNLFPYDGQGLPASPEEAERWANLPKPAPFKKKGWVLFEHAYRPIAQVERTLDRRGIAITPDKAIFEGAYLPKTEIKKILAYRGKMPPWNQKTKTYTIEFKILLGKTMDRYYRRLYWRDEHAGRIRDWNRRLESAL